MAKLGNPQETIQVLQKHDFHFQKKYGQNFLIDPRVLEKIVEAAEVTEEDFDYFPWSEGLVNYKGSFALYGHGNFDLGDPAAITEAAEISQKSLDYFDRIISLCREEAIPLILVKTPTVDLKKYQPYCNAVEQIAAREGLAFYNFNEMGEETGITGEDFYFDTHLNLAGARKLSRCLAEILLETTALPDHRGDSAYASWDVNAETINDG